MSGDYVCAHIIVKGLVQGVGFRWFVQKHANHLGLNGWVRNLSNGDVEIEVEGERSLVEELIKLVKVGPRYAQVEDVQITWKPYEAKYKSFEIKGWF
ncbi:acylphosphatase [Candidatus Chrysopegis kryptomonas]|jgi:acylphosphatase|uniref:Acylphosphatase n=1 Tax=Candidatus Chryseopegocella kryptomonas TaxID=1633643 RepID=A0A0P1N0E8_9BACT|nr:acylphosphatase [Candidatus Chrysopegis kryptomonas]CUT01857.1 acylphosphatase [Candidatus Chrysopegis kryptomonas]